MIITSIFLGIFALCIILIIISELRLNHFFSEFWDNVSTVEREDMSKWISVKERLPTYDGEYLATVKYYGSDKTYVAMLFYANEFTEIMSLDAGCKSGWYRYSRE